MGLLSLHGRLAWMSAFAPTTLLFTVVAAADVAPAPNRVVVFEVMRVEGLDAPTLRETFSGGLRAAQGCAFGVDSVELGRLHVGAASEAAVAPPRIALSPIGQAAHSGTREQRVFGCVAEAFRQNLQAPWSANANVTFRVQTALPHASSGIAHFNMPVAQAYLPWLRIPSRMDARESSTPATGGTLARATLESQLASYREEVRACFRAHLRHDRQTPASFEVEFEIQPDGSVEHAQVVRDADIAPVSACIVERLRDWRLGPPAGGALRVRHTFTADLRNAD